MNRVLLTGAGGQLGRELQRCCPDSVELFPLTSSELDITNKDEVSRVVRGIAPKTIINAAAYTAVDKAESEEILAYSVNADGAAHLAQSAKTVGARVIQISTDYVFNGNSSSPYLPYADTTPLNVYGASKRRGEISVQEILPNQSVIIRTAWLYSSYGNNFVTSMIRLMKEREQLGVVADQVGTPTYAATLAGAIWEIFENAKVSGVFHWTDAGVASWYDFAVAIMEEALALGLLTKAKKILPIRTIDYPTSALRPKYSVLDKTETWSLLSESPVHWRVALRKMLKDIEQQRC